MSVYICRWSYYFYHRTLFPTTYHNLYYSFILCLLSVSLTLESKLYQDRDFDYLTE